jgi:hypothetical protein
MRKWLTRIILLAALGALGYWGWGVFFPSPEKAIRTRLEALAKEASFSSKQGVLAKAWNATLLADYFTLDVRVTISLPGSENSIEGRDELLQRAMGVRSALPSLKIDFPDIKVVVAPDQESAVVNLTARGKVPEQKEDYLQELRLRMIKVKRTWLINEIVTVRTLSSNLDAGQASRLSMAIKLIQGEFKAGGHFKMGAIAKGNWC